MIYTAKKDSENWILLDDEQEICAKSKVQFKNKNAYGKMVIMGKEFSVLYNPLSFKNNREHVKLSDNKNVNDTIYRNKHFDKKHGFYYNYYLRWFNQTYFCCCTKKNDKSIIYIYQNKKVICIMEGISVKHYEIVDVFLEDDIFLDVAFAFLTSLQIFIKNKKIGISNYAPAPLNTSDIELVYRVKARFLRENDV